jgi:hypothetical protein
MKHARFFRGGGNFTCAITRRKKPSRGRDIDIVFYPPPKQRDLAAGVVSNGRELRSSNDVTKFLLAGGQLPQGAKRDIFVFKTHSSKLTYSEHTTMTGVSFGDLQMENNRLRYEVKKSRTTTKRLRKRLGQRRETLEILAASESNLIARVASLKGALKKSTVRDLFSIL